METLTIYRVLGVAAIAGGALRIVNSFTGAMFDSATLDRLYFATDVLLMLGTAGWYFSRAQRLGTPGLAGFVVAVFAIAMIRSGAMFGPHGYMQGAALLVAGLIVMNLLTLFRRDGPILPVVLWLVSLIVATMAFIASGPLAAVAGVLFGLGFIAAGVDLWRGKA
ncbi:MAG TPA: hypothetical protein VG889_10865 [Rhizomicrobium sp.]|nr:hypothetical protein [Rhizomicrobium sp.]